MGIVGAIIFDMKSLILVPSPTFAWSMIAVILVFDIVFLIVKKGQKPVKPKRAYALMVLSLVLALSIFWGNSAEFIFFAYFMLPILLSLQTLAFSSNKKGIRTVTSEVLHDIFVRGFSGYSKYRKDRKAELEEVLEEKEKKTSGTNPIFSILIALVVAVPVALIVISILSEADEIFRDFVLSIEIINVGDIFGAAVIGVVGFFIAFSYLYLHKHFTEKENFTTGYTYFVDRPFFAGSQNYTDQLRVGATSEKRELKTISPVFTVTFLLIINIVYVIFSVIQCLYLFSGKIPSNVESLSQYTVSGFGWLIFLTLSNMVLLMISILFTKREKSGVGGALKVMLALLIVNNGIMGVSAYLRLSKYEEAYGFTETRMHGYIILAFIAVFLLGTLIKIMVEKLPLKRFTLVSTVVFILFVLFFNMRGFVTEQNVNRYLKDTTKEIDIEYLESLGTRSVHGLEKLVKSADDNKVKTEALSALIDIRRTMEEEKYKSSFRKYKTIREMVDEEKLKELTEDFLMYDDEPRV